MYSIYSVLPSKNPLKKKESFYRIVTCFGNIEFRPKKDKKKEQTIFCLSFFKKHTHENKLIDSYVILNPYSLQLYRTIR